jgi:hypothetical protein
VKHADLTDCASDCPTALPSTAMSRAPWVGTIQKKTGSLLRSQQRFDRQDPCARDNRQTDLRRHEGPSAIHLWLDGALCVLRECASCHKASIWRRGAGPLGAGAFFALASGRFFHVWVAIEKSAVSRLAAQRSCCFRSSRTTRVRWNGVTVLGTRFSGGSGRATNFEVVDGLGASWAIQTDSRIIER